MITRTAEQVSQSIGTITKWTEYPLFIEEKSDPKVAHLLKDLSPKTAWGDREIAAKKLGNLRNANALTGLLDALLIDNFWMVRCAIIQALEKIGDARAVPVLSAVAEQDGFQVVRSYAAKVVERLS